MEGTAAEYHSKDFEWEELRDEVENDASLRYHLVPFVASSSSSSPSSDPPPDDADAWRSFHRRHSAGKFFKVLADIFDTALSSLHFYCCLVTSAPNFVLLIIASGRLINVGFDWIFLLLRLFCPKHRQRNLDRLRNKEI